MTREEQYLKVIFLLKGYSFSHAEVVLDIWQRC